MKDIVVIDHIDLIRTSYQTMAKRLKELAKRNMRVLKRKEKIKRIYIDNKFPL